jgi:hypothetical protein
VPGRRRFFDFDRDGVILFVKPLPIDEVCSRVETEGVFASAGFDMLLRPSRASLRSVTPTPRVERARLCRETLSMCIIAGDILSKGEIPSPRNDSKFDGRSIAMTK